MAMGDPTHTRGRGVLAPEKEVAASWRHFSLIRCDGEPRCRHTSGLSAGTENSGMLSPHRTRDDSVCNRYKHDRGSFSIVGLEELQIPLASGSYEPGGATVFEAKRFQRVCSATLKSGIGSALAPSANQMAKKTGGETASFFGTISESIFFAFMLCYILYQAVQRTENQRIGPLLFFPFMDSNLSLPPNLKTSSLSATVSKRKNKNSGVSTSGKYRYKRTSGEYGPSRIVRNPIPTQKYPRKR